MFRLSGIHRDVYMYASPKVHIRDFRLNSEFNDNDYSMSVFKVNASVRNYGDRPVDGSMVEVSLLDPSGKTVAILSGNINKLQVKRRKDNPDGNRNQDPVLWSAENPALYSVIVSMKNAEGKETEAMSSKFGFRKIEIKNKKVYVNNELDYFQGR